MISYEDPGKFICVDFDSGNILFDDNGNIEAVIDMDPPLVEDPLFEYYCIRWHHRLIFEEMC